MIQGSLGMAQRGFGEGPVPVMIAHQKSQSLNPINVSLRWTLLVKLMGQKGVVCDSSRCHQNEQRGVGEPGKTGSQEDLVFVLFLVLLFFACLFFFF